MLSKITPCLWFDTQGEDAARFYTSLFPNSSMGNVTAYGPVGPGPEGSAMTVEFVLDGIPFLALNGGPQFTFSEAVSFQVDCADQAEVDFFWDRLSEGGEQGPCGWLKDRFGLSWQVVPHVLPQLISGPDPAKSQAAMKAMMAMGKLDIAELERAAAEA